MSLVARLGLGLSLGIGAVLAAATLPLAAKTETARMTVTATVRPSCLITTLAGRYVRVTCPGSPGFFQVSNTATGVSVDF